MRLPPVHYEDFKAEWETVLRASGLPTIGVTADEALDLRSLARTYEVTVEPAGGQDAEPLFVSAKLSWRWDAIQTARTRTTEEDMLAEVLGREESAVETKQPWMRVDVSLHASLPYGKPMPMPKPAVWAKWIREAMTRLESIEPVVPDERARETDDGNLEFLAWQGQPQVHCACGADGNLKLEAVEVSSWQAIELPRSWDDPDREPDEYPRAQLRALFARVKASLHAWMEVTDHLRHAER